MNKEELIDALLENLMGPRDSVVAILKGETPPNLLSDMSRWVIVTPRTDLMDEFPELWVDKIHDYVIDEDEE